MNPTIEKFGFPRTLLKEFDHWLVLARPAQVTLGSLVLAARSKATAYCDLSRDAFSNQADAISYVEKLLARFVNYERINYLMLMMVDPNVHFHVIPRYSQPRTWNGLDFPDAGWPGPPQLGSAIALSAEQLRAMAAQLGI